LIDCGKQSERRVEEIPHVVWRDENGRILQRFGFDVLLRCKLQQERQE
jgi:hypothetical protein